MLLGGPVAIAFAVSTDPVVHPSRKDLVRLDMVIGIIGTPRKGVFQCSQESYVLGLAILQDATDMIDRFSILCEEW